MPPRRGSRAARTFTAPEPMPTRNTRSQSRQAGPVKERSSLVADPVARKGAPRGVSASEAEIPTSPRRNEDSDDDVEVGPENGESHVVAQASEEDLEFMCQCVYKLGSATENILSHYRVFGDKDKLARRAFIMNMDSFASVRKQFLVDEAYAPFLHWAWATTRLAKEELDAFKVAVILANLATLLETIWEGAWKDLDEAGSPNAEKLRMIDEDFKDLLIGDFQIDVTEAVMNLALEVRVAHVLAALAKANKNSDARKILYDIFCSHRKNPTSAQINATLENGPYKHFVGIDSQELDSLCRKHIAVFSKHIGKNSVTFSNLPTLRKQYPAKRLLASIQSVFREFGGPIRVSRGIWKQLEYRDQSPNEFFDAASGGEDDISSDEDESQPIVRASDAEAGHSLFRDQADAEALERVQATADGGIFAVDHSAAPFPSALSHRTADRVSSTPANQHQRNKRTYKATTGDDYDDDDDVFETDTRSISEAAHRKRRLIQKADATRVDQEIRQQQRQHEHSPFLPSSSLSTSTTAVGGSTQADKHARQANSVVPRNDPRSSSTTTIVLADGDAASRPRARPPMHSGRVRWSQNDDEALLASIGKHYAKWADIERQAKHMFEHPRDQQAYRDRARNLKVKYILNDEPLPYGFDWVTFGPKEKERLLKHGKNYQRMEADIDKSSGRPTNTEYIPVRAHDTPGSE
ncbi:SANT SWI3, ADA2, N-coR and TFIIIB'' DNA-binding domain-containing protein [Beauveria brongniartii RCEF 3172]|uniref:SANT SWI3, ADA2, N-coR and TFIIIB'' DNA-binding domain-containing protein n=1 Tax=Beauveria brongniartii RCEF 3172 TaxID=1081107 RepID=A0A162LRI0_9HYPO|nr:SANT SWI3, ADA2, N-coR and TFIIIB'' DNA-binding domain-containing protein [Beauveria brongniartii RCEF 3172]